MNGKTFLASSTLLLFCCPALAQFGSKVQYFPQFAIDGPARTFFSIHNPGEVPVTVDLTLTRSDGSTHVSEQVTVQPGSIETIAFGEPGGTAIAGWAKLTSDREFTATLFYRIEGVGNVGVLPSPEAKAMKVMTFVREGTDTGFAVANPSDTATSNLTFQVSNAEGQLLREVPLTLGPHEHRAFLFSESPYEADGRGLVTVLASEPVIALALRLDGTLLSSVGVVVPGLPIRGEWHEESPNIIGGYRENRVREGMIGGTIGGGGNSSENPDGGANFVTGDYGTVGGGKRNTADTIGTVGGGDENVASGETATVGGGFHNTASDVFCTVGGGAENTASGQKSTVGGGEDNEAIGCSSTVSGGVGNVASGTGSTVGGGGSSCTWNGGSGWVRGNTASGGHSVVAGGISNEASETVSAVGGGDSNQASGIASTVSGGGNNIASGYYSTVPGGASNEANGSYSFAAGRAALALHDGAFVWSDDSLTDFQSSAPRQFLIRAAGGVGINTNSPHGALDVNGSIFQRGGSLHADYVFEPDYRLETIEEHSRLMWQEKHLPALQGGAKDEQGRDVVEYGSRIRGILEELEKAHVYIEQLNARLARLEAELQER